MSSYAIFDSDINHVKGIVIDVRSNKEHAFKHLAYPHKLVPLENLNPNEFMAANDLNHSTNIYLLCHSGSRACKAAQKFLDAGYTNVNVIDGGIVGCETRGDDIKVKRTEGWSDVSIERQVRIVAGTLIAGGAILTMVSEYFAIVPLVIGGGLLFSGLTDTCTFGTLLMHAPWNK